MVSLLESIASPLYLKESWDKLNKSNRTSHGMSYETIDEFKNTLDIQIQAISKQLLSKKYSFNEVRAVLIPKKNPGEFRPLRIADIRDRLVQKALSSKLEELLSAKYLLNNQCSFAYQKDKGIEQAIGKMIEHFKNGCNIILEADIKKFFDTVNRKKLLQKVFDDLPDTSINNLIEDALSQSVGNLEHHAHEYHHYFLDSIEGIPQGNSLSPLLANIYLADFDQRMINEKLALVRYADDFIVLCKSHEDAERALLIAKEELEKRLGLELHDLLNPPHSKFSKTRIVNPFFHVFSFLSIRFDGRSVWVSEKKVKGLLEKISTITDVEKYNTDKEFKGILTIINKTKNLIEGWLASYKFVDVDRDFSEIDPYISYRLCQAFIKLGYKLKPNSLDLFKFRGEKKHSQIFNKLQRENSGVPYCEDFIKTLDRNKISI